MAERLKRWINMRPVLRKRGAYQRRDLGTVRMAVIHHSGSRFYQDGRAFRHFLAIAEYHVRRGWPGIGYHYGVDEAGAGYWLGSAETIRYHAGNWDVNRKSVGIVLPGNFNERFVTEAQAAGVKALLRRLDEIVSEAAGTCLRLDVQPHSAVRIGGTECPGDHAREWLDYWRNR